MAKSTKTDVALAHIDRQIAELNRAKEIIVRAYAETPKRVRKPKAAEGSK